MIDHEYELQLCGKIFFFTNESQIEVYDTEDNLLVRLDPQDIDVVQLVYNHLQKQWREDDKEWEENEQLW